MQMKIEWVKPQRGRNSAGAIGGFRVTRNDYNESATGVLRQSTVLRFSVDVMKKARFVIGDRVFVGVASVGDKRFIAIKRVPEGGFTISGSDKGKKGSVALGHVKTSSTDIPLGEWTADEIKITDNGVLLAEVQDEGSDDV